MEKKQKGTQVVAIITMFFMFAMISFVTNMAAPFGNIWKNQYSWAGMWGNMMNFLAYLIMGIPAGKLMSRIGYKKTALIALAVGFVGMVVQYLSSLMGADVQTFSVSGQRGLDSHHGTSFSYLLQVNPLSVFPFLDDSCPIRVKIGG